MQAQATLINFTVTRDGLEEQLLAEVVATERPDLEKTKVTMSMNKLTHDVYVTCIQCDQECTVLQVGITITYNKLQCSSTITVQKVF